ncbi:Zn-dependent hydrolase [Mesorhizobium sp. M7A.F.Ca.CA.001.06.1.1]|uniref:Zn-dependent hydrolase n=1 Tax=Mesorhizobium sp. M7A.F.Ca.CA.001.06.1.1 TaxID=2496682 RepID=UPI000FCBB4E2|nr:Zn-dependent hydrolase [Mesorhizobium sp. M7A.F.Ca.CA.001.06.1.1]RVB55601.1 Zn-dependent hydrolase [Mesorhizobium sp. M7A.F.Ca.CA.001.06.1.1]
MIAIDAQRLLGRIRELGAVGRDGEGRLTRLAASDTDRQGRDLFVGWLRQAGLDVAIDRVGNIFGIWQNPEITGQAPLLIGSHIDTVIDAGIYDGCYGVLAGLEVIETLKATGFSPSRPVAVAAFTNEEGVRYTPDMMGSLVHAGGIDAETVLAAVGTDGSVLGQELARIGYAGDREPGFLTPHAYLELHIEQGPVLEREGLPVGAIRFEPNAINVIPSRAVFTVDLRDPDEQRLQAAEAALAAYLEQLAAAENVTVSVEQLARFEPVIFDLRIVEQIEAAAKRRGLGVRRMTSGAGHDAQMLARIAPAAMIFVPSVGGISHSPREHTDDAELVAGANILLDVAAQLAK